MRENWQTRSTCERSEKLEKKKTQAATSPRGGETPAAIAMNFVPSRDFTNTINCAKYDLDRLKGFQPAGP
jgi:hypothetical protein